MKRILTGISIAIIVTVILCGGSYLLEAYVHWKFAPIDQGFRMWFLLCAAFGITAGAVVRFDDKKRKR